MTESLSTVAGVACAPLAEHMVHVLLGTMPRANQDLLLDSFVNLESFPMRRRDHGTGSPSSSSPNVGPESALDIADFAFDQRNQNAGAPAAELPGYAAARCVSARVLHRGGSLGAPAQIP